MWLEIRNPALLFLLIPGIAYFVWMAVISKADLPPFRRWTSLAFRIMVLLLILIALSGAQLVQFNDELGVLFLMDFSDSMDNISKQRAMEYVQNSVKNMGRTDKAGLIVFGQEAVIEQPVQPKLEFTDIYSAPPTGYTDIAKAIRLALASFPGGLQKRIVLITDGNENLGQAVDEAVLAQSQEVEISVVPMGRIIENEVMITDLILPRQIKEEEPLEIKTVIESQQSTSGKLHLFLDQQYLGPQDITLVPGKNAFSITHTFSDPGFHTFQARVETPDDVLAENNKAEGFCMILGKPKALLISSEDDGSLEQALLTEKVPVEHRFISHIPSSLPELQNYDLLILDNVPALAFSISQMEMIRAYVRDLGGGLMMIGGDDSFGIGGYFRTPIEEALPVNMDLQNKQYFPSLAMMLLIDKSGSMGGGGPRGGKIEIAREAAIAAVDLLTPRDQVGVLGFDDAIAEVVALQPAKDKKSIADSIATLRAGGGTSIYPALNKAYEDLASVQVQLKHIILMTDGRTMPGDFDGLMPLINDAKITVSTVAIGGDADMAFLERLAINGKGRFYSTNDINQIPQIFAKETILAQKSYIVEGEFFPVLSGAHQSLKGIIETGTPPLLGYVATRPKERAEISLQSNRGDPLLAHWRFGLGKATAFTSDSIAKWAKHWVVWRGYPKFWAQQVRWTMRQVSPSPLEVNINIARARGEVTIDAMNLKGEFLNFLDMQANIIGPDMQTISVSPQQVSPGRYKAIFPADQLGTYLVSVTASDGDTVIPPQIAGVAVSYPPEYLHLKPNVALIDNIASRTRGTVGLETENVFLHNLNRSKDYKDIWERLLLIALLLMPFDIAVRRVMISREQMDKVFGYFAGLIPALNKESSAPGRTMSALKKKKAEIKFSPLEGKTTKTGTDSKVVTAPAGPPEIDTSKVTRETTVTPKQEPADKDDDIDESSLSPTQRLLRAKQRARKKLR